jgi:2-polyprenyl-3-methyl-5-hydroxy-6-metoxy-1,4-benzoquinol methylase
MKVLCPYCKTESGLYFPSKDYNRKVTQEIFNYYLCPQCNLIFIAPIPQNLNDYYASDYHFVPETIDFLEANSAHEQYKIDIIQQYVEQGRLLEIGPSLGGFSYLAKKTGFEVEAIEMDAKCSAFLNEIAGIQTVNSGDTCNAIKKLGPFDVIALWHVIEHLPNPWKTLEAISERINIGGILILAAPSPNAFQFQILGRYWPHVDAPRHLLLIPKQQLIDKMTTLGMSVELVTTCDEGGLRWNIFGWEYFFANLCKYQKAKKVLKRVGQIVAKLASTFENVEGKGSAYTIVFRKAS